MIRKELLMALSLQRKFLAFGAVPVAVLSIAGASAFTFGQDISQINGTQEQTNYLVVASNATSIANKWVETSYIGNNPDLTQGTAKTKDVKTKYGELPQWFQVNSGASGVPSAVQEPGDLLFINAQSSSTSSADTDNGNLTPNSASRTNAVQAIHVKGNITNIAALRQTYATCLIPIRLYKTTVLNADYTGGANFTEVTQEYLDTQSHGSTGTNGQTSSTNNYLPNSAGTHPAPFYVDCTTGEFEFTVPTADAVTADGANHSTQDLAYEVTVERGGVFSTFNNNTGAQPEFVFQSTPLTYDPTNQNGHVPGATGNGQYTPNLKNS
jgi:hypothetical protein